MKKILVSFLVSIGLVLTPLQIAKAEFLGCPQSWQVKLPSIKFDTLNGSKYRFISYDGDTRKGMAYQTFLFSDYYPKLSDHIKSLGPDAVMKFEFEISDTSNFVSKIKFDGNYAPYVYQVDYPSMNVKLGIPSNPYIRTSLSIEQRNCQLATYYSNSIQAENNYKLENLDEYFLKYKNEFYNFKQEELLRKALIKNYSELSNPILLKSLLSRGIYVWKTEDDGSLNRATQVYFNALSPIGCLSRSSNMTTNLEWTKNISFESLPCKVGIFFNNPGSLAGHLIQVMDFQALPTPSATPTKVTESKKTTITCVKGKFTKKVTAVKPKCPTGYKVKK